MITPAKWDEMYERNARSMALLRRAGMFPALTPATRHLYDRMDAGAAAIADVAELLAHIDATCVECGHVDPHTTLAWARLRDTKREPTCGFKQCTCREYTRRRDAEVAVESR